MRQQGVGQAAQVVMSVYRFLLKLYPHWFQNEFKEELLAVFSQVLEEAASQGRQAVVRSAWHELKLAPLALIKTHRIAPIMKKPASLHCVREPAAAAWGGPTPDLPLPDGRTSWAQAVLEISPCLAAGILLVTATYLLPGWIQPGWQRDMDLLGTLVVFLPFPALLAGLARGLPRWAFPLAGMVLGFTIQSAQAISLAPLLGVFGLAAACLAVTARLVRASGQALPSSWQRIGRNARRDWSRWSFGVYGALPWLLSMAFDNSYTNNRTPYLLMSVLLMISGALVFARSRRTAAQIGALLVFASLSLGAALINLASFNGGLESWLSSPSQWLSQVQWMGTLWAAAVGLMLAPLLFVLVRRTVTRKRMG